MSQKLNLGQYGEARFIFSKQCFECVFLKKHAVDIEPQLISIKQTSEFSHFQLLYIEKSHIEVFFLFIQFQILNFQLFNSCPSNPQI